MDSNQVAASLGKHGCAPVQARPTHLRTAQRAGFPFPGCGMRRSLRRHRSSSPKPVPIPQRTRHGSPPERHSKNNNSLSTTTTSSFCRSIPGSYRKQTVQDGIFDREDVRVAGGGP